MAIAARMDILYDQLRVTQLQARLRRRSIPFAGLKTKQQLIDRLIAAESERIRTATPNSRSHLPSRTRTSTIDTLVADFLPRVLMAVAIFFFVGITLMQMHYNHDTLRPWCREAPKHNLTYAIDNGEKLSVLSL